MSTWRMRAAILLMTILLSAVTAGCGAQTGSPDEAGSASGNGEVRAGGTDQSYSDVGYDYGNNDSYDYGGVPTGAETADPAPTDPDPEPAAPSTESTDPASTDPDPDPEAPDEADPSPVDPSQDTQDQEPRPQTEEVTVVLSEFAIDPVEISVRLGTGLRITVVNRGQTSHSFRMGGGYSLGTELLPPGGSQVLEFVADTPGQIELICGVPGHKEAGMVAAFNVQ